MVTLSTLLTGIVLCLRALDYRKHSELASHKHTHAESHKDIVELNVCACKALVSIYHLKSGVEQGCNQRFFVSCHVI